MSIRKKIFLPVLAAVVLLGTVCALIILRQFDSLQQNYILQMAELRRDEILRSVSAACGESLEKTSLFTKMPDVIAAFETAHKGNMENESDPEVQIAREMLRRKLKDMLEGYSALSGERLKLHFHLPNGRSLVRMWQEKQIQANGQWEDISDDISGFRNTVMDVNRTGKTVKGIEPGRGGFAIRGVMPVKNFQGKHLGSAEILLDFAPLLKTISSEARNQEFMLFMNAELLSITHPLHDPQKYPVIGNRYVRVSGGENSQWADPAEILPLLDAGQKELSISFDGKKARAAFPVMDYKNRQIGILTFGIDISRQKEILSSVTMSLSLLLAGILVAGGGLISVILFFVIHRPMNQIASFVKEITRGDLTLRLSLSQKDEMGELARVLDRMSFHMDRMLGEISRMAAEQGDSIVQISAALNEQAATVTQQSASVSEISATMEEFSATSAQIAENSETVVEIAGTTLKSTQEGVQSLEILREKMNKISEENRHNVEEINALRNKTDEITKIMGFIDNIADQTRLIAFNASIEAAAAGEKGRRFGVVASEIRRLADSVTESTGEIETKMNEIREAVHHMVVASEAGTRGIREGLNLFTHTVDRLNEILSGARSTTEAARQISLSTHQQKSATEQIVVALREISQGAGQNSEAISHISEISDRLKFLSEGLQKMMKKFILGNPGEISEDKTGQEKQMAVKNPLPSLKK
ncbi:MAG: methyl-accepting chemotaxis protein [Desulfococcaceae bacterium]